MPVSLLLTGPDLRRKPPISCCLNTRVPVPAARLRCLLRRKSTRLMRISATSTWPHGTVYMIQQAAIAIDVQAEACRVCGATSRPVFQQQVIGHSVRYFDCAECGYVQTEQPHWLDQAYSRAINDVDTGIMARNDLNVKRVLMTLLAMGQLGGRVIDHAGGYGILVRMLRDKGVDARWRDKYCENVVARGFEASDDRCELLTAFEVLEHMVNPLEEIAKMLEAGPTVLISTELVTSSSTPQPDWWYYGPEHGQHIGFFRPATLEWIAAKLGCYQASDGVSLHLFSKSPVPARWLALVKLKRFASLAARFAPASKTMSDFQLLRKAQ